MSHQWDERTWKEIEAHKPEVALLPVGSTEAHGPHLPLSTDSIISQEMAKRAAFELQKQNIHSLILPCIDYAITEFSKDFSGTISIRKETFQNLLRDIADNVAAHSIPLLCIVNSHLEPDHIQAIQEFCDTYKKLPVLFPDKTKRPWGSLLTAEFKQGACHAGSYETSLVLSARAELVRSERKELPPNPVNLAKLMRNGVKNFRDAGADQAYFGDPAGATQEEGEQTYSVLTRMIVETVLDHFRQQ
ncbi:creatininase family protein [bacterium]|nr:creatininase family protein [bacterium]